MKKQNDKKRVDWKRRGIVAAGVAICVLCGAFIFGFSRLHEGVGLSAGASADSYVMESAASVAPMMNEMAAPKSTLIAKFQTGRSFFRRINERVKMERMIQIRPVTNRLIFPIPG